MIINFSRSVEAKVKYLVTALAIHKIDVTIIICLSNL